MPSIHLISKTLPRSEAPVAFVGIRLFGYLFSTGEEWRMTLVLFFMSQSHTRAQGNQSETYFSTSYFQAAVVFTFYVLHFEYFIRNREKHVIAIIQYSFS